MKDAVGSSLLLNIVVIFTAVIILLFSGIISYSKAYKIKNRIVEIIERYEKYDNTTISAIEDELKKVGYTIATKDQIDAKCTKPNNLTGAKKSGYLYCVYEKDNVSSTKNGKAYEVVTFVRFDFPVIGQMLEFPVQGETKVLGKVYDY